MLGYSVWCASRAYQEEYDQTKRVAAFTFLLDAVDYAASLARNSVRCVLIGPYGLATEYVRDETDGSGYTIRDANGRK